MPESSPSSPDPPELPLRRDEAIEEPIRRGEEWLVITTQRLLLDESGDDEIDWAVERPNVETVRSAAVGGERLREWGKAGLVLGPLLLALGVAVPWDGLLPSSPLGEEESGAAARFGAEWAVWLFEGVFTLIAAIDTILVFGGVLTVVIAAALLLGWAIRRRPILVVETAGGQVFRSQSFQGCEKRITAVLTDDVAAADE